MQKITRKEQISILEDVENGFSDLLKPSFNPDTFLQCKDNFSTTKEIKSIKIFEGKTFSSQPIFTIAIPTYNRHESLKRAINSALNQTFQYEYEIIVVENIDNNEINKDVEQMLFEQFHDKITYYRNEQNIGLYANLNRCLFLAKGKWVCLLHSDDIIFSNYLSEMHKLVTDQKYKDVTLIGNQEYPYKKNIFYFFKKLLLGTNKINNLSLDFPTKVVSPNSVLHLRDFTIEIGGYNPDEFPSADMLLYYRIYKYSKAIMYQEILQKKYKDLSLGEHPKTIVQFAIIDLLFILHYVKPYYFAKIFASDYIGYYLDNYLKNFPILYSYINDFLKDRKIKRYPRWYIKIHKFIYLFLNYKKKYF